MNIRPVSPQIRMNQVSFSGTNQAVSNGIKIAAETAQSKQAVNVYEQIGEFICKHTPKKVTNFINNGVNASFSQAAALGNSLQAWSGMWVGGLYVINTHINKNIPEERKPALHINNIFTSVFALVASTMCFDKVNKMADNFGKKHFSDEKVSKIINEIIKDTKVDKKLYNGEFFRKGIKFAAQTALITGVFRFVGPVIAGPIAQQIVKFSVKKGWIKDPKSSTTKPQPPVKQEKTKELNTQLKSEEHVNKTNKPVVEKK